MKNFCEQWDTAYFRGFVLHLPHLTSVKVLQIVLRLVKQKWNFKCW